MRPRLDLVSEFELERLASHGSVDAKKTLDETRSKNDIFSLIRLAVSIILVAFVLVNIAFFGWLSGCFIAIVATVLYEPIGRLSFVHTWAQKLYVFIEPKLFIGIKKYPILRMLRGVPLLNQNRTLIHSRQEFLHEVEGLSSAVLSDNDKRLIVANLSFSKKKLASATVVREKVVTIKQNELLGPLALDDLHKTGHSRFPVIDGGIDRIVGVVAIDNLVTLADKESPRAKDVMTRPVHHILYTETLQQALALFLETKQNLLVVVDTDHKTVGIICLEDVIAALLGTKPIDKTTHDA